MILEEYVKKTSPRATDSQSDVTLGTISLNVISTVVKFFSRTRQPSAKRV